MDAGFYTEAEENKRSYLQKMRAHAPIKFIHTIAESYEIKSRDNVFFFLILFNPYFRTVIHNIWKSYEQMNARYSYNFILSALRLFTIFTSWNTI